MGWITNLLAKADQRKQAIVDGRNSLTYGQLCEQLLCFRRRLVGAGIGNARAVGLAVEQSLPAVVLFLAMLDLKLPLLPYDPSLTAYERERISRLAGVDLWVTPTEAESSANAAGFPAAKEKGSRLQGDSAAGRAVDGNGMHAAAAERDLTYSQIASARTESGRPVRQVEHLLLLTSGTSGPMKAARIPYASLLRGAHKYVRWFRLTSLDKGLAAVPLYHSYGLIGALIGMLAAGGTLFLCPHPTARRIAEKVAKDGISVLFGVPQQYDWLSQSEMITPDMLSSLAVCICSGGTLNERVADAFYAKFQRRVLQVYGSTETGAVAAQHPVIVEGTGAVGFLMPGVDVSVTNDGRLAVDSDTLFAGYVGEGQPDQRLDCFITGDRGTVRDRRVYLTGRVSPFINLAGRKVDPHELREVLIAHPAIADALVTGVPDSLSGERIVVYLTTHHPLKTEEVIRYMQKHVASYKIPQEIHMVDELPVSWKKRLEQDCWEDGREYGKR
ncbi:MAG: acyl--CoA ligase [Brevibacillus sp.]|nr:acyl--CoA ligase [Brevibacillus sp.]